MKDIIDLIARILIACIFLFEAYDSIKFFQTTQDLMTSYGITWRQDILLTGAIFLLIQPRVLEELIVALFYSSDEFKIFHSSLCHHMVSTSFWTIFLLVLGRNSTILEKA